MSSVLDIAKKLNKEFQNNKLALVANLTPLYKMLWVKYLDKHPELVEYASQFDEFNDKFRGKSINCQADVIRAYVKGNRRILLRTDLVKELSNIIREIA